MKSTKFGSLLLVTIVAASPAPAKPPQLIGNWAVGYDNGLCMLWRNYGSGTKQPTSLIVEPSLTGGATRVFIMHPGRPGPGRWGAGWVADNHPEKVACDFCINEGGGSPTKTPSGIVAGRGLLHHRLRTPWPDLRRRAARGLGDQPGDGLLQVATPASRGPGRHLGRSGRSRITLIAPIT